MGVFTGDISITEIPVIAAEVKWNDTDKDNEKIHNCGDEKWISSVCCDSLPTKCSKSLEMVW